MTRNEQSPDRPKERSAHPSGERNFLQEAEAFVRTLDEISRLLNSSVVQGLPQVRQTLQDIRTLMDRAYEAARPNDDLRMTPGELARTYGGSTRQTINNWCKRGLLPYSTVDGEFRIVPDDYIRVARQKGFELGRSG